MQKPNQHLCKRLVILKALSYSHQLNERFDSLMVVDVLYSFYTELMN